MSDLGQAYGVNEEQAKALDINNNIALRAGAGSGKTRVLTKRFVRHIIENRELELDQLIAITFTRKAATEMKARIRKELDDWQKKVDTEQEQELAAAFGIQSIPSLLFIPKDDKPQMAAGALPKDSFVKIIDEVLNVKPVVTEN